MRTTLTLRILIVLLALAPCVACDQATKQLAIEHLKDERPQRLLGGTVSLIYAENPGAFLGLGRALPKDARTVVFSAGVAVMLVVLLGFLVARRLAPAVALGLGLMLAGGVGNLVDRFARKGRVVDFVQLKAGPLQTGIFNVADVYIVGGAGLVLLFMLSGRAARRSR